MDRLHYGGSSGCGTAVAAAQELGRRWIGIDITDLSSALMESRLRRDSGLEPRRDYEGTPESVGAAQCLFKQDPFQFQFWAVGLMGRATSSNKKGKRDDTGIDGVLYFRTPGGEKLGKAAVSVKGGRNFNPGMVRDLAGVVEREKAAMGLFISLHDVTSGMHEEAAKAGAYRYGGTALLQVLAIRDLLDGSRPALPRGALNVSLENRAVRTAEQKNQGALFGE